MVIAANTLLLDYSTIQYTKVHTENSIQMPSTSACSTTYLHRYTYSRILLCALYHHLIWSMSAWTIITIVENHFPVDCTVQCRYSVLQSRDTAYSTVQYTVPFWWASDRIGSNGMCGVSKSPREKWFRRLTPPTRTVNYLRSGRDSTRRDATWGAATRRSACPASGSSHLSKITIAGAPPLREAQNDSRSEQRAEERCQLITFLLFLSAAQKSTNRNYDL